MMLPGKFRALVTMVGLSALIGAGILLGVEVRQDQD